MRNCHFIKAIFGSFKTAIFGSFETAIFRSFETAIFRSFETAIFGSFETAIFGSFETAIFGSLETAKICLHFCHLKIQFPKANFLQFQNYKKLLSWNGACMFQNFLAKNIVPKSLFFPVSKRLKIAGLKREEWKSVFKSPFYAVLIHPKRAVSKRQVCLRFETPNYDHKRTLLYA